MKIDFTKSNGLVPAIIQHYLTGKILMLGYMNEQAYKQTMKEKKVTFFSRSKQRLWTKGEISGNYLYLNDICTDCDGDTLLVKANPQGPVCHTGGKTCFKNDSLDHFIYQLESIIQHRQQHPQEGSYTNQLLSEGINRVAQKVGEEAVEVVIEAKDQNKELFKNEVADLVYHLLVLLRAKNISFKEIDKVLQERHNAGS